MKSTLLAAAAAVLLLAASCANPASPAKAETGTVSDSNKLGFEGTLTGANYSSDDGGVAGGSMGMAFAADTVRFKTGAQSLKVTGTSRENMWVTGNFYAEATIALGTLAGDFTDKTVTFEVYVPTGSSVAAVNLTLLNAAGKQKMLHEQALTAGQWNTVSITNSPVDYNETDSTFTGIEKLRLRFLTRSGETGASAAVEVNVDSVNW